MGLHELRVCIWDGGPQLAALGIVRELPALTKLDLRVEIFRGAVECPPFIPPSLKALRLTLSEDSSESPNLLMGALPGMLDASGATLEHLEVQTSPDFEIIEDQLVNLAQVLCCCSPTLTEFHLGTWFRKTLQVMMEFDPVDYAGLVDRLHAHWPVLLAGVSSCRELEVLMLPRVVVEPLFPPGTAFHRLTHLEICDHERGQPPGAGVVGLWELMASGGLPALAKLKVSLEGLCRGVEDVTTRVVPAFEAVARTLTHLHLEKYEGGAWLSEGADVGYAFGMALAQLRRLKDLFLGLLHGGRTYQAVAQGLASSGEERPLPLLWRVSLPHEIQSNADLVTSLLLPGVRVFFSFANVLTACALRQAGYKHTWITGKAQTEEFDYSDMSSSEIAVLLMIAPGRVVVLPLRDILLGLPWAFMPQERLPSNW
jgi:hypothetical protein